MAGVPEVKTRILGMSDQTREKLLDDLLKEIKPKLKAKQIEDLMGHNKALLNSLRVRENISVVKDGKEAITANILDDLENKLNISKTEKSSDFKKAARDVVRAGNNIEKMDQAVINQKLKALAKTVDQDIEGHIAQIYQLAQTAGVDVDRFFNDGFNKQNYQSARESYKNISTEKAVEDATASIKEVAKSGASQETVASVIDKKVDEFAKKTLIDKAGWSQGAVDIGKFVGGLYLAFKAIGFANDQFPSGLEGLVLKVGAAYSAYAGYGKYKGEILNTIKKMTGQDIEDSQNKPSNELSHRKLESEEFQHGEMLFKGILASFKNQSSDKLTKYIVANNFNLVQFIADYSGEEVTLGSVKSGTALVPQQELHTDMISPKDKEYNHIAMIHRQIIDGKGEFHQKSINSYIVGLGFATAPTTVQGFNEAFTTYESIQKARYNILKKAGYEMDLTQGDKRSEVDEVLDKYGNGWRTNIDIDIKGAIKALGYLIKPIANKESLSKDEFIQKQENILNNISDNEWKEGFGIINVSEFKHLMIGALIETKQSLNSIGVNPKSLFIDVDVAPNDSSKKQLYIQYGNNRHPITFHNSENYYIGFGGEDAGGVMGRNNGSIKARTMKDLMMQGVLMNIIIDGCWGRSTKKVDEKEFENGTGRFSSTYGGGLNFDTGLGGGKPLFTDLLNPNKIIGINEYNKILDQTSLKNDISNFVMHLNRQFALKNGGVYKNGRESGTNLVSYYRSRINSSGDIIKSVGNYAKIEGVVVDRGDQFKAQLAGGVEFIMSSAGIVLTRSGSVIKTLTSDALKNSMGIIGNSVVKPFNEEVLPQIIDALKKTGMGTVSALNNTLKTIDPHLLNHPIEALTNGGVKLADGTADAINTLLDKFNIDTIPRLQKGAQELSPLNPKNKGIYTAIGLYKAVGLASDALKGIAIKK